MAPDPGTTSAADIEAAQQAQNKLNEDLRIAIERLIEENRILKERATIMMDSLEVSKQQADLDAKMLVNVTDILNKTKEQIGSLQGQIMLGEKLNELFGQINDSANLQGEAGERFRLIQEENQKVLDQINQDLADGAISQEKADADRKKALEEFIKENEKLRAQLGDVEKFADLTSGHLGSFGRNLTGASSISGTLAGQFGEMASHFMGEGALTATKMGAAFRGLATFGTAQIAGMLDMAVSLAIEIDSLGKSLQASTGLTKNFESVLTATAQSGIRSGVGLAEASEALGALANNLSSFNPQADHLNKTLATNVAQLKKFGVAVDQSVAAIEMLTNNFGMSETSAASMATKILTAGNKIGITTSKMSADFNSAMKDLVQFGDEGIKVFQGLAAQAKATGVEMSSLISVAKGFDTFDSAATAAAKLNTVLGAQFSAIELLNADYEETIMLLREGMGSPETFNNLDRFTKLYVQQALGVSSVSEAQRILTMDTAKYLSYRKGLESQRMTQEQLAKATADLVPITQQLKLSMTELALALAPALSAFIDIASFLAGIPELVATAIIAFAALNGYLAVTTAVATAAAAGTSLFAAGLYAAIGPVLLVGVGLYALYKILTRTGSPAFYDMFNHMADAAVLMAKVYKDMLLGALQIIADLLLGMYHAVTGVFHAFFDLVKFLISSVDIYPQIAGGIMLIAVAVGSLGIAAAASLFSVGLLFTTIGALSMVFSGLGILGGADDLALLGTSMEKIGNGMKNFVAGLAQVKSVAAELAAIGKDSFIAVSTDGAKTTAIVANETSISAIQAGKISVDVKIPEIKVPKPVVNVYIDGNKADIKKIIFETLSDL